MSQAYKNVIFRNKIGIPTILGSRSLVIQKTILAEICYLYCIVECVNNIYIYIIYMYMLNFAVRTVPTSWETTAVLPPRSHVRTCTTQMKALTVLLEPNFATKLLHTEHLSDSANKNAKENDKSMPRSQHEMDRLYYEHRGAHRANELQTSNYKKSDKSFGVQEKKF